MTGDFGFIKRSEKISSHAEPPTLPGLNGSHHVSIIGNPQEVSLSAITEALQCAQIVLSGNLPPRLLSPESKPEEGRYKLLAEAPGELNRQLVEQLCRVSANYDAIKEELQLKLMPILDRLSDISMRLVTSRISSPTGKLTDCNQILDQLSTCISGIYSLETSCLELLEKQPELLGSLDFFEILVELNDVSRQTNQQRKSEAEAPQTAAGQVDLPGTDSAAETDADEREDPEEEDETDDAQASPETVDSPEGRDENNDYDSIFLDIAKVIMRWPVSQWFNQPLFDPHALLRTQLVGSFTAIYPEIGSLMGVLESLGADSGTQGQIHSDDTQRIFDSAIKLLNHSRVLRLNYQLIAPAGASYGYVPKHCREKIQREQGLNGPVAIPQLP